MFLGCNIIVGIHHVGRVCFCKLTEEGMSAASLRQQTRSSLSTYGGYLFPARRGTNH